MSTMTTTVAAPTGTSLWEHQQDAIDWLAHQQVAMLEHGMGGGKTLTAITYAEQQDASNILVLCPKSVVDVWPDQVRQHAHRRYIIWSGEAFGARGPLTNPSVAKRATTLLNRYKAAVQTRMPFLAVVNYEASWQGDMAALLLGTPWDLVILDESHRIKSPGGKQSKLAARVCARARDRRGRVLALTGTPMPHSPLDLWAQFRALDGGARLGTSYTKFCAHFGAGEQIWTPGGVQRTVFKDIRPDRLGEFTQRVAPIVHRVPQDELDAKLGLPEFVDTYRACDLEPATRRVYQDLEKHLIAEIDNGTVSAANAMVLVLRLAQVANGFAPDIETGAIRQLTDGDLSEKSRLLKDVLEDFDTREPIVVFCRFHHDLDQVAKVCEQTGRTYGELSGRTRDGMDGPRMNSRIDVLGAQLKSGGVGIDLTRARVGIWYSSDWTLADYLQARKRLHRPGQRRRVLYMHLLTTGTVDYVVYAALRRRREVIDAVLAMLSEER